jgi:hypothetical protein
MYINITISENDLKLFCIKHVAEKTGVVFTATEIDFLVKTKSNYKAEWERGEFKVEIKANI